MCQYIKAFKITALGLLRGGLVGDKDLKEFSTKNFRQDMGTLSQIGVSRKTTVKVNIGRRIKKRKLCSERAIRWISEYRCY